MNLHDLGYTDRLEQYRVEQQLDGFAVGRVIAQHRDRYVVRTEAEVFDAEITGNMRYTATGREDFPAVGDWVALNIADPDFALIQAILPRSSTLKRQAVGQNRDIQIIATNINYAFLVQAADRDWNINRLERYLTICNSSDVSPIVLLTKIDLVENEHVEEIVRSIQHRIKDVPVIAISNETKAGFDGLIRLIKPGRTYCMLGSSGVGKSTLLNNLSGRAVMRTDAIGEKTGRGVHVTTHRELTVLESGGILIDNPGMREVSIADTSAGLEATYDEITGIAEGCRFSNCIHTNEPGCAVIEAVEAGEIDRDTYENFLRLQREKAHYSSTVAARRKKDKDLGKIVKNYKKMVGDKRKGR